MALLAVVLILFITGRKSVHHELIVNAPPEEVWKVLTDTERYNEWNPVMELVEGEIKSGNKVVYRFTQDENTQSEIPATVRQMEANKLLNQFGGMPFILTYDHTYMLEAQDDKTRVTIHEDYRGIGVNFWNPTPVEEAYGRLNHALKNRVEQLKD